MSTTDSTYGIERTPEQLERLLAEARKVRGNSLWKDALRHFRRSRVSVVSFWFVILVSLGCFLAPLLPLAPHTRVRLDEQYLAPNSAELRREGSFLFRRGWPERLPPDMDPAARRAEFERLVDLAAGEPGFFNLFDWALVHLRARIFADRELVPLMGTDALGRCLMARVFWGGRISLLVGLVATLVSLLIGVTYGAFSGYMGGRIDNVMMRAVDVMYSIPFIFVVIFLISVVKAMRLEEQWGISRMVVFFGVIGAIYWLTMARVVRGQVLSIKHSEFVQAARVIGAGTLRILFRHLLPNVMAVVLVYLTLTIPRVMLFEAFLSFLGLGVEAPDVSWGMLAADGLGAINPLKVYWWFVLFPSLALGTTLLALNFLGDGLRDALDPRLQGT